MPSSSALPICRVDWRPSRLLASAIAVLGSLALWSLWLSALPVALMLVLAVLVVIYTTILIRRERRREPFTVVWTGGDEPAALVFDIRARYLSEPKLAFRGPLAGLRGKNESGRVSTYLWWPDTLSSAARRQLRLADQIGKQRQTAGSAY
jgi:toxin CptA